VAAVQGDDPGDPEAFGDGDDAGVDNAAQVEIGVGLDQLRHPGPVGGDEALDGELAGGQGAVEGGLGARAELAVKQPASSATTMGDASPPLLN
jgi:hypothetical protein